MKTAIQTAREKFGGLDAAVNCAGIGVAFVTYNKNKDRVHQLEDFTRVLNVREQSAMYLPLSSLAPGKSICNLKSFSNSHQECLKHFL